ncbi:MBOAT family protein [Leptospira kanakyensis]|uniref:MBOAT family protein n=1 Tax=Leptospira kanakyensis TaxID=2484968 RepID=A0A6N4QK02_9LEPT|nr:MBOAT family protein [Leptospira kanakyensis]TGK59135.1 MBOAT family protein [Leptospira kanakyensis]TGK75285.1 MBOAT family protein [Leptospira kanakyensis]
MLFNSAIFALFLPAAVLIWHTLRIILPKDDLKYDYCKLTSGLVLIVYLVVISAVFYCFWNPLYFALLLWVAFVDFWLARTLGFLHSPIWRKSVLGISLANSLGILIFFKYGHFIDQNWAYFTNRSLFAPGFWADVLLPVGISFYTFQSISYLVDVYRKELEPEKRFLSYLLFLSFFPQLVAGPIVTAKSFLPQIRRPLLFPRIPVLFAIFLILLGLFKKMVLADHLAETSDFVFLHVGEVSTKALWVGMFSYSFQIYCDFSGYTDIAQGAALLFGFRLPENFKMPYLSAGFSEFWTRWHISLSQWLKKYIYISLGGNRISENITYRNLFLVMAIGGLWHGASWNFLVWGVCHGILLILERSVFQRFPFWTLDWMRWFRVFFTFLSVSLLWIFFRSSDFASSLCYLQGLFVKKEGFSLPYTFEMNFVYCLLFVLVGHIFGSFYFKDNRQLLDGFKKWENSLGKTAIFGVLVSVSLILIVLFSADSKPFVYFVF